MASKALSVCSEPGCPWLAVQGGRCGQHQKARKRWSQGNTNTVSVSRRGYDYSWQHLSAAFLIKRPECEFCGKPATDVDHITPKRLGGSNDEDNLQALCHACHSRKTARGR